MEDRLKQAKCSSDGTMTDLVCSNPTHTHHLSHPERLIQQMEPRVMGWVNSMDILMNILQGRPMN